MNDLSVEIKNTFTNLVKIYSETSSLLLDAGTELKNSGFTCPHGNVLGTEQSKHIDYPDRWITYFASRYYTSEKYENIVLGIGAFFLDSKFNPIDPILVFGTFNMKPDKKFPNNYWYLKEAWFEFNTDIQLNKKHNKIRITKGDLNSATLMAIKLTDIKNREDIKNKVISPLLDFIE